MIKFEKLEIERKEGYFNISGLRYTDEEAMYIADYIVNVLQDEHINEHGLAEYQDKFGDEGDY